MRKKPAKTKHYHTSDPAWRLTVTNYLRAGFGVEDIAIKMREREVYPNALHHIRDYVASMREAGTLAPLFDRKKHEDHLPPE